MNCDTSKKSSREKEADTAWNNTSTLHEFQTTNGRQQPCSAVSPGWLKCSNPPAGSTLFEAMAPGQQPQLQRDHVLLHGSVAIADAEVDGLAVAAARWHSLVENAPNMLPHKVLASDLLGKAEVALVQMLRPIMIQRGFPPSPHISQAVERFRYDQNMSAANRTALEACLTDLCNAAAITLDELFQFETLAQWSAERNSCFHPLGHNGFQLNADAVAAARMEITTRPEFQAVRASSLLLVRILESWLPAPPLA